MRRSSTTTRSSAPPTTRALRVSRATTRTSPGSRRSGPSTYDVDVNSTKLGRTVAQRNDKLTRHKVVGNLPSSRPVTSQAPRSPTLFPHRSLHAEPRVSSSSECFAADMVSSHVYSWEENLPKSERNARHSAHAGSDVSGAAQAAAPEWTPPRRGVRGRGPSASSP